MPEKFIMELLHRFSIGSSYQNIAFYAFLGFLCHMILTIQKEIKHKNGAAG